MANVKFGRLTASAKPLLRTSRPGYEKTLISIEFKYHLTNLTQGQITLKCSVNFAFPNSLHLLPRVLKAYFESLEISF